MTNYKTFATIKTCEDSILIKSELTQDEFLSSIEDALTSLYDTPSSMRFTALDGNPMTIAINRLEDAVILTTEYVDKK
jgi:hypothetical protein